MIKKVVKEQYFHRNLEKELIKWLKRPEIFVIKGPRQAGKTTLLKKIENFLLSNKIDKNHIHNFTFEDFDLLPSFETNPKKFIKNYAGGLQPKDQFYFLLDEFHYIKNGGKLLKLLYDLTKNIKFIITGSSSLEIADHLGKFLVGRAFLFNLYPLSFEEFILAKNQNIKNYFQEKKQALYRFIGDNGIFKTEELIFTNILKQAFEEFIIWGGYPEVIKSSNLEEKIIILRNIYQTYINKDIINLLKITDTRTYYNLLQILANQIGSLLNYQNLGLDSGVNFKELKRYLSTLEETYIIQRLNPYHQNLNTELKKNPKIFFIDSGLRNYLTNNFSPLEKRADAGHLAENFVYTELLKNLPPEWKIKYWRTKAKAEVDFVLSSDGRALPIEVKYATFKQPKITNSFRSFLKNYQPKQALVLTRDFMAQEKFNNTQVLFAPIWFI